MKHRVLLHRNLAAGPSTENGPTRDLGRRAGLFCQPKQRPITGEFFGTEKPTHDSRLFASSVVSYTSTVATAILLQGLRPGSCLRTLALSGIHGGFAKFVVPIRASVQGAVLRFWRATRTKSPRLDRAGVTQRTGASGSALLKIERLVSCLLAVARSPYPTKPRFFLRGSQRTSLSGNVVEQCAPDCLTLSALLC
jgi:hypothetical protein